MKKIFTLLLSLVIVFSLILSCTKTNEKIITIHDSVYIYDTIYLRDTIQRFDTLFIFDTIIHFDTIVSIDTVIVYDTSEFAYLFRHYELDLYDVLFYTIDKQKSPRKICKMRSDEQQVDILLEGNNMYPVWSPEENHIFYIDLDEFAIAEYDLETQEVIYLYNMTKNMKFLRYFPVEDMFLVSYDGYYGNSLIGAVDYHNDILYELSDPQADEYNPSSSDVDDWIYFSRMNNGTLDIFRRKLADGFEEEVYIDPNYNLATFSISSDGRFLITPKYKNGKGIVVFYDVNRRKIIHELELPVEGHPMYASLSKDNRGIFFVNGTPYNYSEPRNIYRMGLDQSQLLKLTNFTDQLASRPLIK